MANGGSAARPKRGRPVGERQGDEISRHRPGHCDRLVDWHAGRDVERRSHLSGEGRKRLFLPLFHWDRDVNDTELRGDRLPSVDQCLIGGIESIVSLSCISARLYFSERRIMLRARAEEAIRLTVVERG